MVITMPSGRSVSLISNYESILCNLLITFKSLNNGRLLVLIAGFMKLNLKLLCKLSFYKNSVKSSNLVFLNQGVAI